jgi:metal-sulfur cluster biosynthetic enzyme
MNSIKDNENPVVLTVDKRPRHSTREKQPLGYERIRRLGIDDTSVGAWPQLHARTVAEQAVCRALQDVARATNGRGVSLLRKAGAVIPVTSRKQQQHVLRGPMFIPADAADEWTSRPLATTSAVPQNHRDPVDADEIFEIIRNIQDPEHPLSLEQLGVVSRQQTLVIERTEENGVAPLSLVQVRFTPTVPHCSMATLIGLCIRVKLLRSLPARFVVTVSIQPGSHVSEKAINKQLADKERVCAALENKHLLSVVNKCIQQGMASY